MTKTNNTFTACNLFWLIGILIFSILVFRVVMFGLVDKEIIKDDILILPLSIWFILLVFQFKAIRKIYVFICWLIVAFLLVTMNIWIIKHTDLANTVNNTDNVKYFRGLFIPLIVLLFYQLCRQISLKHYNYEISMPTKIFNLVPDENRKANWLERGHAIGMFAIPVITLYA